VPRPNKKFVTPFETAATFGHIGCMAVLVEGGVPVNGFRLTGRRALHLATLAGELDAVIWLLAHGADPNQRELTIGPFRWLTKTPAMVAASVGSVSILERLETAGARFGDVYWHRSGRYTALRFAKLFKRDDATRFLEVRVV
jgi:ankyrin repeat protein